MKFLEFDNTRDIPYYNHNPRLSKTAWAILIFSLPVSFILYSLVGSFSNFFGSIVFCLTLLIPLLYFSKWDYSLIFRKPTKNEIILAILMFVAYMIYCIIMGEIIGFFGQSSQSNALISYVNAEVMVSLIFSMMAEELLKFIPLMFFMRFFFKFSNNKNLSIVLSINYCYNRLWINPLYSWRYTCFSIAPAGTWNSIWTIRIL